MKIAFKNVADTFEALMSNVNTAVREYIFQNRDGTIADDTDISGLQTQIDDHDNEIAALDNRIDTAESDIVALQGADEDDDFVLMTSLRNFYNY